LIDIAEKKLTKVRNSLINITNELKSKPSDLKSYVDFCAMIETSKNEKDNLQSDKKDLDDMKIQL
jgi:hypothetical protein